MDIKERFVALCKAFRSGDHSAYYPLKDTWEDLKVEGLVHKYLIIQHDSCFDEIRTCLTCGVVSILGDEYGPNFQRCKKSFMERTLF